MPLHATHPLLQKSRVVTTCQQVAAVVGLDQQCIQALVTLQQQRVVRAQVGQHAKAPLAVADHVLQRLVGVVLDPRCGYFQAADTQALATREKTGHLHRLAHAAQSPLAEVDRYIVAP